MKKVICLLLTVIMLVSAVGCAQSQNAPAAPAEETAPPAAEIVGETGTTAVDDTKAIRDSLTIAVSSDITSLDPHVGKEAAAVVVTNNVFATLLSLDENRELQPYIAEKWDVVDDTTIDFTIRQGIKFHDGSALTAEDVAYSLNRAINSSYVSYIINYAESAEVTGDYTVRLHLKAPYAGALINLAVPFTAIVPKAAVEADPDGFLENPIGCGPYKFVEWSHGNYCKLTRFDDYFLEPAKTKDITFRIIPEASQRTIALENGEVDLVYDLPVNDLTVVDGNENLSLFSSASLTTWYVSMNTQKEKLADKRVRQAIRYAINVQEIIDSVLYGAGSVANSLVPPAATYYIKDVPTYEQDIEKAKALLAEAGYPDGMKLSLAVAEDTTRVAVCQVIQNQLSKIGIEVSIDICDASTYYTRANNSEFELAFYFWIDSAAHADYQYYSLLHSSQKGSGGNRSFFDNAQADEYIVAGRSTMDEAVIMDNYTKLEQIVYDESPNAILCYVNLNVGASAKVDGFVMHPAGYHNLETVVVYE